MTRLPTLLAILAVAGCASQSTMDERYDASLQRWKGATRAELEAAWGKPLLAQAAPDGLMLAWVRRTDIDDRPATPASPSVIVNRGGATTVMPPAALAPPAAPVTCTTRFLLKDGRVASWSFEGLGCGAPS